MPEARGMDPEPTAIRAGHGVAIPVAEVEWRFSPSGGPGGQHANRAHTRVEATVDLTSVSGIPDDVRGRLIERLGAVVSVTVDDTRSQRRNRDLAIERLRERFQQALVRRRRRRPTRPSRRANQRRIESKRRRGATKRNRGRIRPDD